MLVDRNAAAVVDDPDPAAGKQCDLDRVAAGQGFVDGVVHDLVDQVMQAALTGRADVHARPLANCFEAFEDGDVAGVVRTGRARCQHGVRLRHVRTNLLSGTRPPWARQRAYGPYAAGAAWKVLPVYPVDSARWAFSGF